MKSIRDYFHANSIKNLNHSFEFNLHLSQVSDEIISSQKSIEVEQTNQNEQEQSK